MTQEQFETNAKIVELERQRNAALTDCVMKAARLALAGRMIGELEDQIKSLNQQIETIKTKIPSDSQAAPEKQEVA